eukprot:Gb_31420 [translate_table: standard]
MVVLAMEWFRLIVQHPGVLVRLQIGSNVNGTIVIIFVGAPVRAFCLLQETNRKKYGFSLSGRKALRSVIIFGNSWILCCSISLFNWFLIGIMLDRRSMVE